MRVELPSLKASILQVSHPSGCPGSQVSQWADVDNCCLESQGLETSGKGCVCAQADSDLPASFLAHWWHLDLTLTDTMFLHVFCPDTNSRVSESIRSIFPEIHSDLASKEVPGHILLDIDNDTESTAL